MRELDVLLDKYVQTCHKALSGAEKLAFQRLLGVQDPIIMDWLFSRSEADDEALQSIINQLQRLSGIQR